MEGGNSVGALSSDGNSSVGRCPWRPVEEPQLREAQPTQLPGIHLPAMPENLLSVQSDLKRTKCLYANIVLFWLKAELLKLIK